MKRIKQKPNAKIIYKTNKTSFFLRIRLTLLYSFPVVLYFSYFPVIPLFSSASTNYELSLPLIWLFLFSLLSLKDFFSFLRHLFPSLKNSLKTLKSLGSFAPLTLLVYLSLSLLWSPNPLRGFLTVGVAWCLYISIISLVSPKSELSPLINSRLLLKIFLLSAVVFSLICWGQVLLDVFGISRDTTLLCLGCTSHIFGFPHPSGFAIEPQFMGNLLLAPTLLSISLLSQKPRRKTLLLAFFLVSTLFLIFSRGAIYSFLAGLFLLLGLNLFKLKNKSALKSIPLVLASLIFVIVSQGIFTAINKTYAKSFACGVTTSVSQLSLGVLDFPCVEEKPKETAQTSEADSVPTEEPAAPVYSGYVEESTNTRLNLNRFALELASENNRSWFFGFGLGSAGTVLNRQGKTASPKEIIQNEYLSLLLETGAIGLILFVVVLLVSVSKIKDSSLEPSACFLLYSILLASSFSLLFFSGLPNALHLYLFPAFLFLIFSSATTFPEHKSVIN